MVFKSVWGLMMFIQNINYIEDKNPIIPIGLFIQCFEKSLIVLKNLYQFVIWADSTKNVLTL